MSSPVRNEADSAPAEWDERRRFVGAVGTVLRQTVGAFEGTVSRITELTVLNQKGTAGRELVVALQEFDRLQQEFATLGQLLEQLSGAEGTSPWAGASGLLSEVSIAGLKNRLSATLEPSQDDVSAKPGDLEF